MPKYALTLKDKAIVCIRAVRDDYDGPEPVAEFDGSQEIATKDHVPIFEFDGTKISKRKKADVDRDTASIKDAENARLDAMRAAWDSLGLDWTPEQCEAIQAKLGGVI